MIRERAAQKHLASTEGLRVRPDGKWFVVENVYGLIEKCPTAEQAEQIKQLWIDNFGHLQDRLNTD